MVALNHPRQAQDRPRQGPPATVASVNANSSGPSISKREANRLKLANLVTVGAMVAWLAFACYALAYLVSH